MTTAAALTVGLADRRVHVRGSADPAPGGGLNLRRVHTTILRNLAIAKAALNAIGLEASHDVWVDHCDLSGGSDGLIDIAHASDFVAEVNDFEGVRSPMTR